MLRGLITDIVAIKPFSVTEPVKSAAIVASPDIVAIKPFSVTEPVKSAAIVASPDIVAIKPFSVTEPVKSAEQTSLEDVLIDANDDVYYYEHGDTPGICVEHGNGSLTWSPVKFTRREVKTPSSVGLSDDVIDAEKCLCVEYQRRDNIPGFEILTKDDSFWVPVALTGLVRTSSHHLSLMSLDLHMYFLVCCVYWMSVFVPLPYTLSLCTSCWCVI